MALIDQVKELCLRLAGKGWRQVFLHHGLDITASDLAAELSKDLPAVDRSVPGFEDYSLAAGRGVEPGDPGRSLLFHALASPLVTTRPDGKAIEAYPTMAEIEAVENYAWARQKATLADLRRIADDDPIAIAVFAYEHRPGLETVHGRHADLVFSRTGVARIGNEEASYDAQVRGYMPLGKAPRDVRVLPARYAAFVAVQRRRAGAGFGPLEPADGDGTRRFWVPLHKLFTGPECLGGLDLSVRLIAKHRNEKLRRVHLELARQGLDGGWREPDISAFPFVITEDIAAFSKNAADGEGLLVPVRHPLVEPASFGNKPLSFKVPQNAATLSSSVFLAASNDARRAPEYVHARTMVKPDGTFEDLNERADVVAAVQSGGYRALHYLDWTGDGWVAAECPELATEIPRSIPAFSLVTAPDFFPTVGQRELLEWVRQSVPTRFRKTIWVVEPATLAQTRLPPNIQFPGAPFRAEDNTVTAVVSLLGRSSAPANPGLARGASTRHAYLPDAAAGEFAPGWDVSFDRSSDGVEHLASYGLGSPFPEDAKLCAALSTFWPSVAPDAARTFQPSALWTATNSWPETEHWPSIAPLSDAEIGIASSVPWDGVVGPKLVANAGAPFVEYTDIAHADYVLNAIEGKMSLATTSRVGDDEYRMRVLYMARLYAALGVDSVDFDKARRQKAQWSVLSFRAAPSGDGERAAAESGTGTTLAGAVSAFRMYKFSGVTRHPTDVKKVRVAVKELVDAFVDPLRILIKRGGSWTRHDG